MQKNDIVVLPLLKRNPYLADNVREEDIQSEELSSVHEPQERELTIDDMDLPQMLKTIGTLTFEQINCKTVMQLEIKAQDLLSNINDIVYHFYSQFNIDSALYEFALRKSFSGYYVTREFNISHIQKIKYKNKHKKMNEIIGGCHSFYSDEYIYAYSQVICVSCSGDDRRVYDVFYALNREINKLSVKENNKFNEYLSSIGNYEI
jgi:hypothetical protein